MRKESDKSRMYKLHARRPKRAHPTSAAHTTVVARPMSAERSSLASHIPREKSNNMIASNPTLGSNEREKGIGYKIGGPLRMSLMDVDTLVETEPGRREMVTTDEVGKLMGMEGFESGDGGGGSIRCGIGIVAAAGAAAQ